MGDISMQSVPQSLTTAQCHRTVADVCGDRDTTPTASPAPDWPQAVAQVGNALCAKLRLETPPERIRNALDLVLAHAVTLHADGTASVQGSKDTYTLAPHCPCPDAKQRTELCKHTIAVDLHRRALKLYHDTAPAVPPATVPEAVPSVPLPATATGTAAWLVQEAPTSACFKWRMGSAELTYTFRGVTDEEVLTRIREQLPLLQDILAACETRAAARPAIPEAAPPQAPPDEPDKHTQRPQASPQAQETPHKSHANGHTATNGHANGHRNGQRQRQSTTGDQDTGWCSLHNVAMHQHVNDRGTWCSHTLGNGRYCKGAK
jgi:hypothetical protein